ncbi:MAG: ABC transporter permease subunit [Candidatus Hydrogenedentes bacterium]|nr:ABC transporter permease subunit [Candidatus Hydrogenedentota bacterium]
MIRRIWLLYRIEVFKASRRRQPYVGPLLLTALVLLSPLLRPILRDGIQDYGFIAYITPVALNFLGYIMLLTFASTLVVSETARGSVRAILLRPVLREEFILAKVLLGFSYAALLTAVVGVCAWAVAWTRGDLMGVHVGGELVYTTDEMWKSYVAGALLSLLPQWAGVSVAVLFSTLARSTSMAISLALGSWILVDLAKYPLGIAPYVFTTYLEAPWRIFSGQCDALAQPWMPMAAWCAASSGLLIVLPTALAILVFKRRNLGAC